ncbi:hypothetical protein FRC04_002260 [Tulasnella sp. 424]|nr:hypothetical protein FRC04_002260 [Tulasnella sp. 424]KAG8977334.1 hypothetical protein FRC05_001732 [Tulasnella sp. 425]
MDQNYYPHHPHFAHLHHHPHPQQYLDQYDCQPQEFYIPPPHTAAASSHQVVVCDATFEEASQQQQQSFITPTQLNAHHHFANAEEGGPIGWVPPEERGFQHQSASTNSIASNEVSSIAYPTVDQQQQQPQFAPTFLGQQPAASTSNWASQQQPRPAPDMGIYQMAGEAVSFHHEQQQVQVQVPSSDVIPGPSQPQSTGNIPQVAQQAPPPIGMLASQAVYPSTLLDPSSATSPSIALHHQQQHSVGGTPGYPQPAVAQGYNDVQAQQHQAHLHEVTSSSQTNSNLSFSTSSGASSTGTLIAPVPNASSSPSDSLYPVGMYTPCGSSESMAILNGEITHHQQAAAQVPHQQPHQLYSASGSYEVQSQYLAHQPLPTSARAQTFRSGLSDSTSNFITSPTSSSSTPTHGAVVVQQPQPLAPSRTSSLAAWADVPPTPIVGPEHGPVMGPGVQEYHHHQPQYHHHHPQYHHHADAVKEEEGALQVYSPVQQQQQGQQMMKMEMVGQDAKPLLHQAYAAMKPVSPQAPVMSRSSTDGAIPRVQPQPLSRSATVPDMSPSAAQRPSVSANAAAAAALAPTRSVAEFDIAPRPVEAIKASETVRQAAKLHVDVGQADPNSPTSHEARLKARSLRRKGSAAPPQHGYSPYHREFAARRGSSASQHDQAEQQQHAHPQQPVVPSSRPTTALPTDQYGAQRTFIFNPYQDPNALTAEGGKQGPIPHGVPLPTPGMVTAVVSGAAPVPAQHQTIEFSGGAESMSPDELAKGKAIDRNAADAAAMMMGEKKPFLACGFCRQRKIACGQRAPHPRDNEIGEGPRTCNQCARRHILCSFPSESRRGLRKTKPVTKTIVQEDGSEVTITIEDEEEIEELEQPSPSSSKKQSKSKKKGRGPMEWIIAADAWLITPAAWAAHKAAQDKKASEGNGSGPSGAQMYQSAPLEDSPFSAVQV